MNIDSTTKIYLGGVEQVKIMKNGSVIWEKQQPDTTNYFYIENTYSGQNTVTLSSGKRGSPSSSTYTTSLEYSKDKTSWTTISNLAPGNTHTITLNQGEKVYFRNNSGVFNNLDTTSVYYNTKFKASQSHNIGGNILSLLDYTNNMSNAQYSSGCFNNFFTGDTNLVSASDLVIPDKPIAHHSFFRAFFGCTSLNSVPVFSPTTIANSCYSQCFQGCSSLKTVPANMLPAAVLANDCYGNMFQLSGLTSIPSGFLPAKTLADMCYMNLFNQCVDLETVPSDLLPATTMYYRCYRNMFVMCGGSLKNTPVLPATTLAQGCYEGIFDRCSSVDSVTIYANDNSATDCTKNWLNGVAATGTFNNFGTATYTPNSASGIPSGWTVVTQ